MALHVIRHPIIDDILARLRDRETPPDEFRRLARRISLLLVAEATRDLAQIDGTVETPLESTPVKRLGSRVVAVPVRVAAEWAGLHHQHNRHRHTTGAFAKLKRPGTHGLCNRPCGNANVHSA